MADILGGSYYGGGQTGIYDVDVAGGYYNPPAYYGEPSPSGFDWSGIFRTVSEVASPFLKTASAGLGTYFNQEVLGLQPPQLSYGAGAPPSNNALPATTRIPAYSAPAAQHFIGGGGNPYPVITGGGGFLDSILQNPTYLALAGVVGLLVLLVLRK